MIRIRNYFVPAIFVFLFTSSLFAQRAENPWAVSVGADLIYFNSNENIEDVFSFGAPALSLSYYLGSGFSLSTQYVSNRIGKTDSDVAVTSFDNYIKYNLSEKDLMPYLFAGFGFTKFSEGSQNGLYTDEDTSSSPLVGAGLNYFLNDNLALNLSVSYRNSNDEKSYNHLQHIIGLSYNFGMEDSDKDGVPDKKDVCPNVPGLKEFAGCPDTDGDGIPDNKDACPDAAGKASNGGCPDTDGDGIIDKDDACPEAAGSAEMNGCPDTDRDTVADNLDKCPNDAGDASNDGCPWDDRDGDGVADKDDVCPDEAGDAANNGCPEIPEKLVSFIEGEKSTLLFVVNSSEISEDSNAKLKELVELLNAYPDASLVIEGHASSDGSMAYNQMLSEKRANSVKEALIDMGIDDSRLQTAAYGETKPAADNKTRKGRAANRRVKFERNVELRVVE